MFDNIGNKIKTLAKATCWLGIIGSIILALYYLIQEDAPVFIAVLIAVFGSLASWGGSWVEYGFGQLVENSDELVKRGNQTIPAQNNATVNNAYVSHIVPAVSAKPVAHRWRCDGCGTMISEGICPICGKESK